MSRKRPFLDLLRKLPARWHRPLAKALYRCGCRLTRIKTYQRYYTMTWDDPEELPTTTLAGRHWISCGLSMDLLELSMQLDWDHWDHWATEADEDAVPCTACGGRVYEDDDDFEEESADA